MCAFTSASTAATSSGDNGLGWLKSKRRRSAATSEPFWVTWPPSRCLSAACSRWVALWFRSEEHTSELQSLMRISYAVFCLKKKKNKKQKKHRQHVQLNIKH